MKFFLDQLDMISKASCLRNIPGQMVIWSFDHLIWITNHTFYCVASVGVELPHSYYGDNSAMQYYSYFSQCRKL